MSRLLILLCGGFLLACSLQADLIIFNTTLQTPDISGGLQMEPFPNGIFAEFSPGSYSGLISDIELSLTVDIGGLSAPGSVAVLFCSSDGEGNPQDCASLGTAAYTSATSNLDPIAVDFTSSAPTVDAGNQYWIELTSADPTVAWSFTDDFLDGTEIGCAPGTGVSCENFQINGQTGSDDGGPFQMEVEIAPSPEPANFLLATSAFAMLALFRRRHATN